MTTLNAPWLHGPARGVCTMLEDAGYQAWFVGGVVRNALIDAPVSDLDLSTDALPETVMSLAKAAGLKAIPTGIDHGTVTIVSNGEPVEVTTFRRDVATDGRHAVVAFSDSMEDDARRRDFTMNALYCDIRGKVADPLGGLRDLHAHRVRFIEDPVTRIKEDYLRILRFFRFYAWYGDTDAGIDADGLAACAMYADGLDGLSSERVTSEMLKLLSASDPAPAVAAMGQSGVLMHILPGAARDVVAVLVHLEQILRLDSDPIRRLVALGGERDCLRLSNAQQKAIDVRLADMPLTELAFRHGANAATDRYLIEQASMTQPVDPARLVDFEAAAVQIFPLNAVDLMPALQGAALGKSLKLAEAKWIASGFTLAKADLL
ncbi:MAG: CCA tRNA nucleotidyltransferase [Yoonia sp.]|tara:strand:- start:1900 stop:3027 length:1128 start_codon:yes stop_codon:yes gene_type:complete